MAAAERAGIGGATGRSGGSPQQPYNRLVQNDLLNPVECDLLNVPSDPASLVDQTIRRDDDLPRPLVDDHWHEDEHPDEEAAEQEEAQDGNQ